MTKLAKYRIPVTVALLTGLASMFVAWLTGYNFDHRDTESAWWGAITLLLMLFAGGTAAENI